MAGTSAAMTGAGEQLLFKRRHDTRLFKMSGLR